MQEIKLGDVLLLPTEKAKPFIDEMEKLIGKRGVEFLKTVTGNRYIHAAMYFGAPGYGDKFWTIEATEHGVWILARPLSHFDLFDVYTHPDLDIPKRHALEALAKIYFNMPYDYPSLVLNSFIELISFNLEFLERLLEDVLNYDNRSAVICSELVARMYKTVGVVIEPKAEFVTPDDLSQAMTRVV